MFENEEWREVDEFPHYVVSNYGRIKHKARPETTRKVSVNERGFPVVTLFGKDGQTRYLRQINVLVARAFLEPPEEDGGYWRITKRSANYVYEEKNAVWHIDGDLTNCCADNLKWETRGRVLEWNEMNRQHSPSYRTHRVKNNRTNKVYDNAYECAMDEGILETDVIWRIEKQARHEEDDQARYRYIRD